MNMSLLKHIKDDHLNVEFKQEGKDVQSIKWGSDGFSSEITGNRPTIGESFLVGKLENTDYWITTIVTKIIIDKPDYVKFKTTDDIYEIYY